MTTLERARKIANFCDLEMHEFVVAVDFIAAEIEAAERAIKYDIRTNGIGKHELDKARAEGFREGLKKAAEMVEFKSGMTDTRHELAKRIRGLRA